MEDNIEWSEGRCPSCRRWLIIAKETCPISAGDLLRGPTGPGVIQNRHKEIPTYVVSFDGGARHRSPLNSFPSDGPKAVGVGAAIWGLPNDRGLRPCLAQATAAIPTLEDSMSAEAAGLRLGIALASKLLPRSSLIGIVGDNLPVMRLGAGNGRIRTPGIWEIVEAPLLYMANRALPCQWTAVRRQYNKTADALATIGTHMAVDCVANGQLRPTIRYWTTGSENFKDALPWHHGWTILREQEMLSCVGVRDRNSLPPASD